MNKFKLSSTRDYRLFSVSNTNRGVDECHIKKLTASMKEYGWIPAFPMLVERTKKGLEIVDGQHRFFVAKNLGLAVWYVECEDNYDVAKINQPQRPWKTKDYAESFVKRGVSDYGEVIEFAERCGMTIADAASILGGTTHYSNVSKAWKDGTYKIRDREHADRVGYLYSSLREISRSAVDKAMRLALIAVARVPGLDYKRLIRNAEAMPERLVKYATREAALVMLEDIYNFRIRGQKFPLKVEAENAMRDRNAAVKKSSS